MKRIISHPVVTLIARLVLGYVFITYGFEKVIAQKDFAHNIMNYELMPLSWVNVFALIVSYTEVLCGVLLLLGVRLRASSMLTAAMLITFIIAIAVAMARHLQIDCGCSAHSEPIGIAKIFEDLLYLALAVQVYLFPHKLLSLESYLIKDEMLDELHQAQSQNTPAAN